MSSVTKRFISFIGKFKPKDVGDKYGPQWETSLNRVAEDREKADPRIKQAKLKGTEPHKSHSNPQDPQDVVTMQLFDEGGRKLESLHVHKDGTYDRKPGRFGQK